MIAQRKYEEVQPVVEKRRRRKKSILRSLSGNPMVLLPVVTLVTCMAFSVYIGAYAGFTEKGGKAAHLMSELSTTRKENEKLRMDIAKLREPEQIESFAKENKMIQCQQTAFLEPVEQPRVAQSTASNNIR